MINYVTQNILLPDCSHSLHNLETIKTQEDLIKSQKIVNTECCPMSPCPPMHGVSVVWMSRQWQKVHVGATAGPHLDTVTA